ncbi:hypothetical protein W02_22310 [Nitrospira sp. KM1]|nr:hypothetical protein W02_22310 [Nitrospira sp. KM1]
MRPLLHYCFRDHMTLFIAVILLYHFQLEWWWYLAAIMAYVGHVYFQVYVAMNKASGHLVTWWTKYR